MKLLLHPTTQAAVERFINKPAHALLIEGSVGTGKVALAIYIASQILGIDGTDVPNHPYFQHITPVDNTISIDAIRTVQHFMQLKTLGNDHPLRRILILEEAQCLTREAQNAFLKLLEEPPADTLIILTAINSSSLLPTIRSRLRQLKVQVPSKTAVWDFYRHKGALEADIDKAYHMSNGRAGLMSALLDGGTDHPLIAQVQTAKELLSLSMFDRLTRVDQLSKQRSEADQLIQALQLICHAGLVQAVEKGQIQTVKRWHALLGKLIQADQSIKSNPNLKLLMTDLLLSL